MKSEIITRIRSPHFAVLFAWMGLVLALAFCYPAHAATTPTSDFTDNGDGTVTHKTTGLTWKRCAEGQTWTGSDCTGTAQTTTWAQAAALTATFAGKSDWRLPNIRELTTITEINADPAINSTIFPNTPAFYFWSASAYTGSSAYVWSVHFSNGGDDSFGKTGRSYVRLVRGGQSLGLLNINRPTTDYVDNGDGTVTHTPTALTWKRCAEGQTWGGSTCSGTATGTTWAAAKALTSTFAGKSDWRLPTQAELHSLVDYTLTNPNINSTIFPNTPASWFWSTSTSAGTDFAWIVDFHDGHQAYTIKTYDSYVRLVRVGKTAAAVWPVAYTDNGDGTVTHKTTGLTWKRCSEGQTWTGSICSGTAQNSTWAQATALTSTFAGKSDWRLPNIRELSTITDLDAFNPAINSTIFPNTPASYFWSAYTTDPNYPWYVHFKSGAENYLGKPLNGYARLVRGGQSLGFLALNRPTTDYADNGDGTVTHTPTALTWKRCAEGQTWSGSTCNGTATSTTWVAATALAGTFAGKSDWRLPTVAELRSLVDFTLSTPPSINSTIFPNMSPPSFWSASAYVGLSDAAWDIFFYDGSSGSNDKTTSFQVRLVRGGQSVGFSSTPADCLFNWAEKTYPQYFAPASTSQTLDVYYYRQYSGTNSILGISTDKQRVLYIGPLTGGAMQDLGDFTTLATPGCK